MLTIVLSVPMRHLARHPMRFLSCSSRPRLWLLRRNLAPAGGEVQVGLAEKLETVDRITTKLRPVTESPAAFIANRVRHCHPDCLFQALKLLHNECARSPRTG